MGGMPREFSRQLLAWYARHKRALPWRGVKDPYRIWISEIMLQQTQVETVIPYYQRWLARFPDVQALAKAPLDDVLAAWEGLGYYSRARNLHRAAQTVAAEWDGALPSTLADLQSLPGIGRYTAGAIASIAFGVDAPVLDGNVKRVLARVFDIPTNVKSPAGAKELWGLAAGLVPPGRAGDFNQALMDLGAMVCTPRAPACDICPLRELCAARRLGIQLQRPVMPARRPRPERIYAAAVIMKAGRVLLSQRPTDELLGGLWAFPAAECPTGNDLGEGLGQALRASWGIEVEVGPQVQTLFHGFTHFKLILHVFDCEWRAGRVKASVGARRWVRLG